MNVDGSLSCTNSNFMKGKEILRLCKDSKQTNMYKAKKIQKKPQKKTNKQNKGLFGLSRYIHYPETQI